MLEQVKRLFGYAPGDKEQPAPKPITQRLTAAPVELWELNEDEYSIMRYGREVGYCFKTPGKPINLLPDARTRLTFAEKIEIVEYIVNQVGPPKDTKQMHKVYEAWEQSISKQS